MTDGTPVRCLLCVKESVMPGIGHFRPGDIVTDPFLIEKITPYHPYFQAVDEELNQEGT